MCVDIFVVFWLVLSLTMTTIAISTIVIITSRLLSCQFCMLGNFIMIITMITVIIIVMIIVIITSRLVN